MAFEIDIKMSGYQGVVEGALREVQEKHIIQRIWEGDYTVWKECPDEITNRLGWLQSAEQMKGVLPEIEDFLDGLQNKGYTDVLLLGMGGSSLAPEVYRKVFGVKPGYLNVTVLDSTDPGAVLSFTHQLKPETTLFIVSTKSGGTVETLSFFQYFYSWMGHKVGVEHTGEHFIAITDPGTFLVKIANTFRFRRVFLNNPNLGGRYSALSCFGLVPAVLMGIDVPLLLERVDLMAKACGPDIPPPGNPAVVLGTLMGELAKNWRDKLTVLLSPSIISFGDWLEQLIAESTGKEGTGILPVVGEPVMSPSSYEKDRFFVSISLDQDETWPEKSMESLFLAGHPMVRMRMEDVYDLGAHFFLWELATALAGYRLGINPFDQPNVESAKKIAQRMVKEYQEKGILPEPVSPSHFSQGMTVYGNHKTENSQAALLNFLSRCNPGDYVSVQAYIQPTPETDDLLYALRMAITRRYQVATTVGYGPRFLHSTGQLHKGDAGRGHFIQITSDSVRDVPIPDQAGGNESSMTFGVLKSAQALGDFQALEDQKRHLIRFHLGHEVTVGLDRLKRTWQ